MKIHAIRIEPGEDLRFMLQRYVCVHQLPSAWIMTGMGSLSILSIRYAGQDEVVKLKQKWEICSLAGTLSKTGVHVHIVASDETGHCVGGHLGVGSIVRTTAEIVLGSSSDIVFQRVIDDRTGYPELTIQQNVE